MKSAVKNIALVIAMSASLAACTSSAISTHGNGFDHKDTKASHSYQQDDRFSPKSHHVSGKGDRAEKYVASGKEHFSMQNFGLAEKAFRTAVEIRSDDASAWMGLAASYDQLGRFDFADRAYKQLAELKGNNARVFNNMGYSQLLRGNYDKARLYLNRAQEIDPGLEEIEGNIHLLEKVAAS